jgi:hypothetical protein
LRYLSCLIFFVLTAFSSANAAQRPKDDTSAVKVFKKRLGEYIRMQKDLESPAKGSEQIADRQQTLAVRIAAARSGSRQGDIFTHEVAEQFEKIIRKAFKGPDGRTIRTTIHEDGPVGSIVLHVNDVYPEGISRTTMPPTLLRELPDLPKDLAYRIIGRGLVLQDLKTNLIVDYIPNAIP